MKYLPGDCLFIPLSDEYYIVVFVANTDEYSYQLAFLDYYGTLPLPANYFENCSFFVVKFGSDDQSFIAFETVTINKFLLDDAPGVNFAGHLDLPGRIGLHGLVPMADVSDITSYFEQYLRNHESQRNEEQYSPFQRSLMDLNEVAKRATPINPFDTVKPYKEAEQTIYYWQIYGVPEPACLVLSQGELGAEGEYQEVKDKPLDSLKEMYARLIEEKKAEGFREWEEISNMILQFGATDSWGSTDDLAFRNDIWDFLNRYLFWTGNGAITGGDIGSGGINLFFHAISADLAVSTINAALAEKGIDRPFIIALEDKTLPKDKPPYGVRVVYPENYEGDFSY